MIAVIADDITGAAEIAGIAFSYGLKVSLTTAIGEGPLPHCDLLVAITNTRSSLEAEAVSQSAAIGRRLREAGVTELFKKCDSVLRGHVAAELHALVAALGKDGALLLPANPSLGRCIIDGQYLVGGKPITETPFAYDPEFPARSNSVIELLGEGHVISANSDTEIDKGDIYIGNVAAEEVLRIYCERMGRNILPAGGGSFFSAWIEHHHRHRHTCQPFAGFSAQGLLLICGSTISHQPLLDELSSRNIVIEDMPADVYSGEASPDRWIHHLADRYRQGGALAVRIARPVSPDPSYAARLKQVMADAACHILSGGSVANLIVEGGATAFCVIERLGWHTFEVVGQLSPGVITLRPEGAKLLFTLKPGSYQWPTLVRS